MRHEIVRTPASSGPFLGLVSLVGTMQADAKARVTLRFPQATIKSVTKGPNTGALYVYDTQGAYVGKVTQTGTFQATWNCGDEILPALKVAALNPQKAAQEFGRVSGKCSCCGRALTDPVSIYGGIGPICLGNLAGGDARAELEADYKEHLAENMLDALLASSL